MLAVGRLIGGFGRGFDDGAQQVGVVVVVLTLQHGGEALEAHDGVDRRPRQVAPRLLVVLLELHEDEVPALDEAVAVLVRSARRTSSDVVAVIVEYPRAGPAGAGVTPSPEVVRGLDPAYALFWYPGDTLPPPP